MGESLKIVPSERLETVLRRVWMRRLGVVFGSWLFWAFIAGTAADWNVRWGVLRVQAFVGLGVVLGVAFVSALIWERPRKVTLYHPGHDDELDILH